MRSGRSHRSLTICQLAPRSPERNRPPGIVPAQSTPGSFAPPATSSHSSCSFAGAGSLPSPVAILSSAEYAGTATSCQDLPRSSERCSLTPKWPRLSAAYQAPSRASASERVTLSPRNDTLSTCHAPLPRASANRPLRVETSSRSLLGSVDTVQPPDKACMMYISVLCDTAACGCAL